MPHWWHACAPAACMPHRCRVGHGVLARSPPSVLTVLLDRRVPLSEGRIEPSDGNLQCCYHGWRFDGSGSCVAIPAVQQAGDEHAHRQACSSSQAFVPSYPVQVSGPAMSSCTTALGAHALCVVTTCLLRISNALLRRWLERPVQNADHACRSSMACYGSGQTAASTLGPRAMRLRCPGQRLCCSFLATKVGQHWGTYAHKGSDTRVSALECAVAACVAEAPYAGFSQFSASSQPATSLMSLRVFSYSRCKACLSGSGSLAMWSALQHGSVHGLLQSGALEDQADASEPAKIQGRHLPVALD